MERIGYTELNKFIEDGQLAYDYAWANFEQLNNRAAAHMVYGPNTNYVGVLAAGLLTPAKERKLSKVNRRKKYIQYELDEGLQVIRIRKMTMDKIDYTYQVFRREGIIYAVPFMGDQKLFYTDKTIAVKLSGGGPIYCASTRENYLYIEFYQYPSIDRIKTTGYLYAPRGEFTVSGLRKNWDAPFGAPDSPVTLNYLEESYCHFDFSEWV